MIAGVWFVLGYLVVHQVTLRIFLLIGTVFYVWYYYVVAEDPLWTAIYISLVMGGANLTGMTWLFLRNSKYLIPSQHRDIAKRFRGLPPADFRMLMSLAQRVVLTEPLTMTVQGQPVDKLYFVLSGVTDIQKRGEFFRVPAGMFVGEVAYLTGNASSATTTLPVGAEILVWDMSDLKKRAMRNLQFRLALEATISRDLAIKVSFSVAPHDTGQIPNTLRQSVSA